MFKDKLFGIISLGCDKNRVDTEKLMGRLKDAGCIFTSNLSQAQILIINTCAFLNSAREGKLTSTLSMFMLPF